LEQYIYLKTESAYLEIIYLVWLLFSIYFKVFVPRAGGMSMQIIL